MVAVEVLVQKHHRLWEEGGGRRKEEGGRRKEEGRSVRFCVALAIFGGGGEKDTLSFPSLLSLCHTDVTHVWTRWSFGVGRRWSTPTMMLACMCTVVHTPYLRYLR